MMFSSFFFWNGHGFFVFDAFSVPMRFVDRISLSKKLDLQSRMMESDLESPCISVQVTRTSTKFFCATSDTVTDICNNMFTLYLNITYIIYVYTYT